MTDTVPIMDHYTVFIVQCMVRANA